MRSKFDNRWVEYKDPIDLIYYPSNMDIGLSPRGGLFIGNLNDVCRSL